MKDYKKYLLLIVLLIICSLEITTVHADDKYCYYEGPNLKARMLKSNTKYFYIDQKGYTPVGGKKEPFANRNSKSEIIKWNGKNWTINKTDTPKDQCPQKMIMFYCFITPFPKQHYVFGFDNYDVNGYIEVCNSYGHHWYQSCDYYTASLISTTAEEYEKNMEIPDVTYDLQLDIDWKKETACDDLFGSIYDDGGEEIADNGDTYIKPPSVSNLIYRVLQVVRFAVPALLIVLGTVDFASAVLADSEEKMKKAQKRFIKRVIAGMVIFLVPSIVYAIMKTANNNEYIKCVETLTGKK